MDTKCLESRRAYDHALSYVIAHLAEPVHDYFCAQCGAKTAVLDVDKKRWDSFVVIVVVGHEVLWPGYCVVLAGNYARFSLDISNCCGSMVTWVK